MAPQPLANDPWVHAIRNAQRRLSRLKIGIAAGGAVLVGAIAAGVAGQSAVASPGSASPAPQAPSVDVFGQSTQPGPDNQPGTVDPGLNSGANPVQQAPPIVSAPS